MTNDNLGSWDKFTGTNFLKVADVASEADIFVCIGAEEYTDDKGNVKPRLTLSKAGKDYDFDLNVTNSNFCKNAGIKSPRMLIGKQMSFKKIMVTSPKTRLEVESLRISKLV